MAKHKAERLDDRHQRENNTGCATCAGSDLADKKSVGDIVEVGHEHADRSWKTEGKHQFVDRRFGHLFILLFISFCHNKNLLLGYKDFAGGRNALHVFSTEDTARVATVRIGG